tara:strand:- start:575 stop:1021 length:447 start_codon:yes stop_codon:yes gene_type:complete
MNLYGKYDNWNRQTLLKQLREAVAKRNNTLNEEVIYLQENLIRTLIRAVKRIVRGPDIDVEIDPEIDKIVDIITDPNNANLDDASLLDLIDQASPRPPGSNPYGEVPAGFVGPITGDPPVGTPGSPLMGPPDPNNPMDIRNYLDEMFG